jgi:elongation factor Ts
MAKTLAEHVLNSNLDTLEAVLDSKLPKTAKSVKDSLTDLNARTGENVSLSRVARFHDGGQIDAYVHHDGSKGALVQLSGTADPSLIRDVAMHIVAAKPVAVKRDDVAPDVVAEQKRIFMVQMANDEAMAAKPEQVREKIAAGKLEAWFKESTLLDQEFVKDPAKRVREYVAAANPALTVSKFARFVVGE